MTLSITSDRRNQELRRLKRIDEILNALRQARDEVLEAELAVLIEIPITMSKLSYPRPRLNVVRLYTRYDDDGYGHFTYDVEHYPLGPITFPSGREVEVYVRDCTDIVYGVPNIATRVFDRGALTAENFEQIREYLVNEGNKRWRQSSIIRTVP